jgi:hypothetical protein
VSDQEFGQPPDSKIAGAPTLRLAVDALVAPCARMTAKRV